MIVSPISSSSTNEELLFEQVGDCFCRIERPLSPKDHHVPLMNRLFSLYQQLQEETTYFSDTVNKSLNLKLWNKRSIVIENFEPMFKDAKLFRVLRLCDFGFRGIQLEDEFLKERAQLRLLDRKERFYDQVNSIEPADLTIDVTQAYPDLVGRSSIQAIPYFWPVRYRMNRDLFPLIGERGLHHFHLIPVDGPKQISKPELIIAERLGLGLNLFTYRLEGDIDRLILKRVHIWEHHGSEKTSHILQVAKKRLEVPLLWKEKFHLARKLDVGLALPNLFADMVASIIENPIERDEVFSIHEEIDPKFYVDLQLTIENRIKFLRNVILSQLKSTSIYQLMRGKLDVYCYFLSEQMQHDRVPKEDQKKVLEAISQLFKFNTDDLRHSVFPNRFYDFYELFLSTVDR